MAELLRLLRRQGVLHAGPSQPVVDRAGRSAPWMFYSWNVSLTPHGSALAARCLLERLGTFSATQLATYGTTGIPLLAGCVLLGGGLYTGLVVREAPKGSPAGRQIEGPADRARPVVLIDDSLSSGRSFLKGVEVLERAGFRVEGTVSLVHFPHRGGRERAEALGYRVETLFDIWRDIGMRPPVHVPGFRRVGHFEQGAAAVADGLDPAQVARRVAEQLLRQGSVPRPPRRFHAPLAAPGGVWVSFRDRRTNVRVARDGFWHFDANDSDPCRDVVLATAKTVRTGGLRPDQLDALKVAVTFFGRLEAISPWLLDFTRHGIVVRSCAWPVKVGGALPNTQVFTSEREQLDLAIRNAQVGPFEPYELYRHTVTKFIEPGEEWLPYGAEDRPDLTWTRDRALGTALTRRAREVATAILRGLPVPPRELDPALVPTRIAAVGVTLYRDGILGCSVSYRAGLDQALVAAASDAARDPRFGGKARAHAGLLYPAVSILHDPEPMEHTTRTAAANKLRLGRDSLAVQHGQVRAVFLESVAPHHDWSKERLVERLVQKARAPDGPARWTTYRTATWLATRRGAVPHAFGFAEPPPGARGVRGLQDDLALLGAYIHLNLLPSGLPVYARMPVTGRIWNRGTLARAVHGLNGLDTAGRMLRRADWRRRAHEGLRRCLDATEIEPGGSLGSLRWEGQRSGPMADCVLLAAALRTGCHRGYARQVDSLAASVAAMFREDGAIHPDGQPVRALRDNDFLPNVAMLARAIHGGGARSQLAPLLEPYRAWQLTRFRRLHRWGQAGWLPQACAEVFFKTGDPAYAHTAFEVADWCLERQVETTGAFLTDLSPGGPGFHTAFVAEGIADAWALALACGDRRRASRYGRAWRSALAFAQRLIIRPVDGPCLADPDRSVGGVRGSLTTSVIRIDFVSHLIIAMCKGLRLMVEPRSVRGGPT